MKVEARDLQELAQSRSWRLLLHAAPSSNEQKSKGQSEADGPLFFFDPELGPENLEAELRATLQAFETKQMVKGQITQTARCAFPARRRLIEQELGLNFPDQCPQFEEWKAKINPEKLSMVLAAPYMGAPSSMFGHVFLKIKVKGQKNESLDWALGFEAVTESSSEGVLYALRGLAGVFPGVFSLLPYHLKINQYSNVDNRDLWEFELNFNSEQLDRMLEHLWELQNTYFDYYFFDENCAYHLLSLLEVANPELKLRDEFHFKAIPMDVLLEVLKQNGGGNVGKRRPAILTQLQRSYEALSKDEKQLYRAWRGKIKELPDGLGVRVLDHLLLWEQYQRFQKSQKLLDPSAEVDYRLLVLRSKAGASRASFSEATLQNIEAKKSNRISFYALNEKKSGFGFSFRPAFHSFLEWAGSLQELQSLELINLEAEWEASKIFRLEQLKFVRVENLSAFRLYHPSFSWFVESSVRRPWEEACRSCLNFSLQAGGGLNFELSPQTYFYLLPSAELRFSSRYRQYYLGLPYLRSGFLNSWRHLKLSAEHHFLFRLPAHSASRIENRDQRILFKALWGERTWDFGVSYRSFLSRKSERTDRFGLEYSRYY